MYWITGHWEALGQTAARAGLIYAAALMALRFAQRRTLAQWTAVDFAAAVAIGAVMGRTTLDPNQSVVTGAVALATLVAAHWVMSVGRFSPLLAKLVDHRVRLLVVDGQLRRAQLRLCGLTDNDVLSQLRQQGHRDIAELAYVLYETKGGLTVVPRDGAAPGSLVTAGLQDATGHSELDEGP